MGQKSSGDYKKGLGFVPNSWSRSSKDPITLLLKSAPTIAMGQCSLSETSHLQYQQNPTVPLFDLSEISVAEGLKREEIIDELGHALVRVGFIGIKAEKISPLIQQLYGEMAKYFRQPLENKIYNWQSEKMEGYCGIGGETGPRALRPDFKESYFISSQFNEFPQNCPTLQRMAQEYYGILNQVGKYVTSFIMEFLGENSDVENVDVDLGNHTLRLAYYPPIKPGDEPTGTWAAPHRDKSIISIMSKGTVPGLQYYSRKGHWEPVVIPDRYILVNAGLLLQHKTAGLIKAPWHRVLNPWGKYTRSERLSTAYYSMWQNSYSLDPFEKCLQKVTSKMSPKRKRDYLENYSPMTVEEKLNAPVVAMN